MEQDSFDKIYDELMKGMREEDRNAGFGMPYRAPLPSWRKKKRPLEIDSSDLCNTLPSTYSMQELTNEKINFEKKEALEALDKVIDASDLDRDLMLRDSHYIERMKWAQKYFPMQYAAIFPERKEALKKDFYGKRKEDALIKAFLVGITIAGLGMGAYLFYTVRQIMQDIQNNF